MYSGVSSTTLSDISSTPQIMQQQQQQKHYVTHTIENNFGPDHIINDLLFPMETDNNSKQAEYNIGIFNSYNNSFN